MGNRGELLGNVTLWLEDAAQMAMGWLTSPVAWSQFALLVVAYLLARLLAGRLGRTLTRILTPPEGKTGLLHGLRRFALRFLPLLLPLIAFGKRLFIFIKARLLVREVVIFGAAFLLLRSIMGIDLTAIAVLGGALGVGIGPGLQQSAATFISSIIPLVKGQTAVGDYVELDGGEKGTIVKMTARACVQETFDGKWIVVPNEHFITSRVINYSDAGSANRYETESSVSHDIDINRVPGIIEKVVASLPFVSTYPDCPDCKLTGIGKSRMDFTVEYWASGIDDGKNRYKAPTLFATWNALKNDGIRMPFPQRVVHLRPAPADV
jgi:small-conductance mechanosensitive channel